MVDSWADLELEIPGPDGEEYLGDAVHGWIFWPKAHLKIMQLAPPPPADSTTSPSAMPEGQDQLPPSPAGRAEHSMSPVVDRDPSESPPPVKGKGFKRRAPHPPPPPKKQNKPKQKKPPPKLLYEKIEEETDEAVREELDRQIFKVKKPPVEKPIDQVKFHRFIRHMEEESRKKPEQPPLTDYDRLVLKTDSKKKRAKTKVGSSSVPQLGTQSQQSIPPSRCFQRMSSNCFNFVKTQV